MMFGTVKNEDERRQADMEQCENCGRNIGSLETPQVWRDRIVCAKCRLLLADDAASVIIESPVRVAPPSVHPQPMTIHAVVAAPPARGVVTIQKTSKIWKIQFILSFITIVTGIVLFVAGMNGDRSSDSAAAVTALGMVAILLGFAWFFFARIMAWWFHA